MRGMNGATGSPPENRAYTGGIPPPVPHMSGGGLGPLPPGMNPAALSLHAQAQAAAAAASGLSGPELKHHADFLSRLLAATPSYMSEMGNPPPGFFSDWLRRLVSKPSGNNAGQSSGLTFSGTSGQPEGEGSARSATRSGNTSTTPSSLDGQISSKRRKRSRLNDHSEHHPLGGSSNESGERPGSATRESSHHPHSHPPSSNAGGTHNINHGASLSSASAGTSPQSSAGPFPHLGAYPFWFFPPFLPPYGMGGLGMGFPSHPGPSPSGPSGLSAAAQAAALSSYLGGASPSELFRTDNLNLLSGSITSTGRQSHGHGHGHGHGLPPPFPPPPTTMDHLNHPHLAKLSAAGRLLSSENTVGTKGKESPPVARSPSTSTSSTSLKDSLAAAAAAASASFLLGSNSTSSTQPCKLNNQLPSQTHYSNNNHNGLHHKMTPKSPPVSTTNAKKSHSSFSISRLTSPSPSSNSSAGSSCGSNKYRGGGGGRYEDVKPEQSVLKSNLNSGPKMSKEDAGLCVDLRVSGRIWENSGVPPPRSIYTPLSAFRDPSDVNVNLFNSSQVPRYEHSHSHHPGLPPPPPLSLLQKTPTSLGNFSNPNPHPINSPTIHSSSMVNPMPSLGKNLSTRYVLRNIQHIYQRLRPKESQQSCPNPNQITTSHPINNHHSPKSPPSGQIQSCINHHQDKDKGKKSKEKDLLEDSENEDNNVIISRPHSSSSHVSSSNNSSNNLDDDEFKPEGELKMAIKDNTLNLTLNNNNVDKGMRKKSLNEMSKKRKSCSSLFLQSDNSKHMNVSTEEKVVVTPEDNPYTFVDGNDEEEDHPNPNSKKGKKVIIKRENNNEEDVEDESQAKKIKIISLSKVKSEEGGERELQDINNDQEENDLINNEQEGKAEQEC